MLNTVHNRPKLIAHKEGKLKSYESCFDVRAWSHDHSRRSSHLRDWIRGDIQTCVVPVGAITRYLRTMTRKHRSPLSPPCSPECRSKAILDNIYTSCHAVKECLRTEAEFQEFFENEEFETSHWPCERCVEIFKSIKLFWNIIVEKLLKIKFTVNEDLDGTNTKSIDYFAKKWKNEIVEQTLQVKKMRSLSSNCTNIRTPASQKSNSSIINSQGRRSNRCIIYNDLHKELKKYRDKATNTNLSKNEKITHAMKYQNVSDTVEKKDTSCNTNFKSLTYLPTKDLINLKQTLDMQETKMKQLENENSALRLKLINKIKEAPSHLNNEVVSDSSTSLNIIDDYNKFDQFEAVKDIASEMIISLKNCTNKSFRNISVLKVLHKSNITSAEANDQLLNDKNPIDVINRIYETFNTIVRREIRIAKDNKNYRVEKTTTSYHELNRISASKESSASTVSKFESVYGL